MKNRKVIVILLIMSLILFPPLEGNSASKKNISFSKKSISLYIGQTTRLKTTVKSKKQKKEKILFSSTNKKIVSVNSKGNVTAKKSGIARIGAKIKGTKKKTYCTVRVGKYVKKINLISANTVILKKNQTSQIRVNVQPKDVLNAKLTYRVLKPSVVTVSKTGKLTAKEKGTSKVKIVSAGVTKAKKKVTMFITVHVLKDDNKPEPTLSPLPTFSVPPPTITLEPETTLQEKIDSIPSPATNQLLAATIVVKDNDDISTLYFVNKAYNGSVTISLNGKSTRRSTSAVDILKDLEEDYAVQTNSAGTIAIRKSYKTNDKWWQITDLELKNLPPYYLRAWQNGTNENKVGFLDEDKCPYKSPYGLIIMKGDTTSVCLIL